MTMKCNMCEAGDMIHEMVITSKSTEEVTILRSGTPEYEEMMNHVATVNSQRTPDKKRITHIYNCEECPNSQLEYYGPENAIAYEAAMNNRNY